MRYHEDPLARELLIAGYLQRRLDDQIAEEFESHYLACDACFEELEAAELLAGALTERNLQRERSADVLLLRFGGPAELIFGSRELAELAGCLAEPNDSKVVLDLSRVSRIDSSGLGELMRMHTHLLRAAGALKVVSPSAPVAKLFRVTHIDSVLDTYVDETAAVQSFSPR